MFSIPKYSSNPPLAGGPEFEWLNFLGFFWTVFVNKMCVRFIIRQLKPFFILYYNLVFCLVNRRFTGTTNDRAWYNRTMVPGKRPTYSWLRNKFSRTAHNFSHTFHSVYFYQTPLGTPFLKIRLFYGELWSKTTSISQKLQGSNEVQVHSESFCFCYRIPLKTFLNVSRRWTTANQKTFSRKIWENK